MDATEEAQVDAVVHRARPDVIIHQLTSLAGGFVEDNARLRTVGTANLVAAAQTYGVSRIVAQSIAWAYAPGSSPATEDDGLDLGAAAPRSITVAGIHSLESSAAQLDEHVVLRYGALYGPGTWYAPDDLVARRIVEGTLAATPAVTSFLHVDDAAAAAVLALDWPSCTVNIVDDDPAPGTAWVPAIAREFGLPSPAVHQESAPWERGASNTLARATLGWEPRLPLLDPRLHHLNATGLTKPHDKVRAAGRRRTLRTFSSCTQVEPVANHIQGERGSARRPLGAALCDERGQWWLGI